MTSPGVVYIDGEDDYCDLRLPKNWSVYYESEWGGIGAGMRWVFKRYPDASQYGWLADDTYPQTRLWDWLIQREAGDWYLAYGRDDADLKRSAILWRESGEDFGAPLCWGGELVRTVGWWAPPVLQQAGIDTAWSAIVRELGLYKYVPSVFCDHRSYRMGKRPADATDEPWHDGINIFEKDLLQMRRWRRSREFGEMIERVRAAMAS